MKFLSKTPIFLLIGTNTCAPWTATHENPPDESSPCPAGLSAAIQTCVEHQSLRQSPPESPFLPRLPTLFRTCTQDLDTLSPWIDNACAVAPNLPGCNLSHAAREPALAQCSRWHAPRFQCPLGLSLRGLTSQSHITVIERNTLSPDDIESGPALLRQQSQTAVAQSIERTKRSSELEPTLKGRTMHLLRIFDLSRSQGYVVLFFGQGTQSFGAVFQADSNERIADILQGRFFIPNQSLPGCAATLGPGGGVCSSNQSCPPSHTCTGAAPLGICILHPKPAPEKNCHQHHDCEQGGCSGLSHASDSASGTCAPGWMFGESRQTAPVGLPDQGQTQSHVQVMGQATVPEDLELKVTLFHPHGLNNLELELFNPGYAELPPSQRPRLKLWPRTPLSPQKTKDTLTFPLFAFSDEMLNGRWTLVARDRVADGHRGEVLEWSLRYSSRFD